MKYTKLARDGSEGLFECLDCHEYFTDLHEYLYHKEHTCLKDTVPTLLLDY